MSFPKAGAAILAACAFTLLAPGCSSSSGESGPGSGDSPTDPGEGGSGPTGGGARAGGSASGPAAKADLRALGAAHCAHAARCSPGFIEEWYTDAATCTTSMSASYEQSLTQPGVSISSAQLNACLAQLKTAACGAELTDCNFKGTGANGAACYGPEQCASGSCFFPVDPNTFDTPACGTCKALAPANGDCSAADCAPGATCINNVCKPDVGVDGACDEDTLVCGSDLVCVGGKCAKPLAENADCTTGAGSVPCDYHLVCANGKCVQPTITFVDVGAACPANAPTGTSIRCRASHCAGSPRKCVAWVEAGQPCDNNDLTRWCGDGLSCRDGKCVADDPNACR